MSVVPTTNVVPTSGSGKGTLKLPLEGNPDLGFNGKRDYTTMESNQTIERQMNCPKEFVLSNLKVSARMPTRTRARMHSHARAHACTHPRTHAPTHHTPTHAPFPCPPSSGSAPRPHAHAHVHARPPAFLSSCALPACAHARARARARRSPQFWPQETLRPGSCARTCVHDVMSVHASVRARHACVMLSLQWDTRPEGRMSSSQSAWFARPGTT